MHSIDYFNIIEVLASLYNSDLGLCSRLHKAPAWDASLARATAVSSLAASVCAVAPASPDTAPDDFRTVVIDGHFHVLGLARVQHVAAAISWLGVFPEALTEWPSLGASGALVAVCVRAASGVLRELGPGGAS